MRRSIRASAFLVGVAGALLTCTHGLRAEDIWFTAHLQGQRAGFLHTVLQQVTRDGKQLTRASTELSLTVKRFNDLIEMRMETGDEEAADGKVVAVFMRQYLGRNQQQINTGEVVGKELVVRGVGNVPLNKRVPWNDDVVGLARQERLFQEKRVRPGDKFTYLSYEPMITAIVNTRVAVRDYEDVEVLGDKRRLLRVEISTDPIQGVQLPPLVSWLSADLRTVRSEVEMPGLGQMVLYRTTAEIAAQKPTAGKGIDIGVSQLISIDKRILRPYDTATATYRIRVAGDNNAATSFARDGRQEISNPRGDTFELTVRARGKSGSASTKVDDEYLQSCYFINSEDAKVREIARQATSASDPWRKALDLERWVYGNVSKQNFTEAFATADQVARTREGDCTEHAMLLAALCRAAGVPSRTALGLVYVGTGPRSPAFGFHMWTEVFVEGEWRSLDGTLGKGYVGATHLKIADHSWKDVQSLTPLLSVVRVLGKLKIDVLKVE